MDEARMEQLREDLARGCPRAYAGLYDQFGARLYRAARTMLRSAADAEDAVQDVFVSLVRSRDRLGNVQNLAAYLFASLRHVAVRRARDRESRRREMRVLTALSPEFRATTDPNTLPDERLEQALMNLPQEQREIIALKIYGGLTFAQVAAVLAIRPNTAASRYRYALQKLRTTMKEQS